MTKPLRVLGLETSCDDTSVAVVRDDGWVEALSSASQDAAHAPFGGIVPEVASRSHTETLLPLIDGILSGLGLQLEDLGGIAVTSRPGLIGSLLVGVVTAKTLAMAKRLPLVGVNHIEGHLLAPFLRDSGFAAPADFGFPYMALAVSGGHTHLFLVRDVGDYEVLGRTVDDAAGEAFDKFAKWMGLGYPGGRLVDEFARGGNPQAFSFPRAMLTEGNLDFSFSGLKTAAFKICEPFSDAELKERRSDLCASFQEAIVDVLVEKLRMAASAAGVRTIVITGGVSANSRLRAKCAEMATREGLQLAVPPLRYCTDNAAMIAWTGIKRLQRGERHGSSLTPSARAYDGDYKGKMT